MSITSIILFLVFAALSVYGGYAMVTLGIKRRKIKAAFLAGAAPSQEILYNPKYFKTIVGKQGSQMASFIIHISLLLGGLLSVATIEFAGYIWFGFLLILLTPATIIVNAFWIYPLKNVEAEQYALYTGKASSLLKTERIIAWVTWGIYETLAIVITGGILIYSVLAFVEFGFY